MIFSLIMRMLGRALSFTFFRETSKITKVVLNDGNIPIGYARFSIPQYKERHAYLQNIEIEKPYRKEGLGTYLLNCCEYTILKKNPNVAKIKSVLWDNQEDIFVQKFFKSNNYLIKESERCVYDDGESIYDILPIEKNIGKDKN